MVDEGIVMLEQFTDRAKGFVQAAQTVAIRMSHQRIAPEHLLKALNALFDVASPFVKLLLHVAVSIHKQPPTIRPKAKCVSRSCTAQDRGRTTGAIYPMLL